MLSSFAESVEVYGGRTWDFTSSDFTWYIFGGGWKRLGPASTVYLLDMLWGWKASIPHGEDLPGGHSIMGVGR